MEEDEDEELDEPERWMDRVMRELAWSSASSEANQEKILEYATSGTEDNGVEQTGEGN